MAYTYATGPADVVVNRNTGQPSAEVRLTIWTAPDGQQVTAGLMDLDDNPLPGYVESDSDGRFPFRTVEERASALWARTPEGAWFVLIANELRDDIGEILNEFPLLRQEAAEATEAVDEFRPEVAAATARSIEALQVAEQANQTASVVIEPEWPMTVAHRGGASVWPEESREAMVDASRAGFPIEVDVRPLADGTLVCCHDDTVDRTMENIGTGQVSDKTLAQWRQARIKPAIIGGRTGTPMTFDEWLDSFGGASLLVPELKPGASEEVIAAFTNAVLTRRLENSLMAQSFDLPACIAFQEAGLTAMFLIGPSTPITLEELTNAGIHYIGTNRARPIADVQAWQAAGIKVVSYTVKTRPQHVEDLGKGFDGVFSDDPWGTSGRVPVLSGNPFAGGHKPYGMEIRQGSDQTPATTPWFMFGSAIGMGTSAVTAGTTSHTFSQPWTGPLTNQIQIEMDVMFESAAETQTQNLGFFLMDTPNDWPYDRAQAGQNGFTGIVRRNGVLDLYAYVDGAAANKIGTATASQPFAPDDRQGVVTLIFRLNTNGGCYLRATSWQGYTDMATVPSGITLTNARFWLRTTRTAGKFLDIRISNPYL